MRLRQLTPEDVAEASRLTDAAFGGGPREERLRRYLRLEPEGWFGIEDAGELLGIGGVVRYGSFAWLGLMAVRPDRQGHGVGRAIADEAIGWARARGCATLCLIATPAGIPLYQRLGFEPDGISQELSGTPAVLPAAPGGATCSITPWSPTDTSEVGRFDAPAFGADRARVLSAYATEFAASAWVARDRAGAVCGFLVVQEEALGPWSASDDAVAAQLLDVGLARVQRRLRVGVLDSAAEALLERRGFARTRGLSRMRLGPPVTVGSAPRLLAHASYALG